MDSENISESVLKKEQGIGTGQNFIEIEIPYNLYRYLNTEQCNVQNMCRICLATDNNVLYPLLATKENSILAHMFITLTSIQVSSYLIIYKNTNNIKFIL